MSNERDKTYFGYYGMLMHQQNMLMDSVRTTSYHNAITANMEDFRGKVVLDIGAGTGILSFFAIQAGAKKVYAVEASNMAEHCRKLVKANGLEGRIIVVEGKVEEITLPEQVDLIVSEPLGTFLVHERMMESFLIGRDRFLKQASMKGPSPNQIFPSATTLYLAPFTDMNLYSDAIAKISFWNNENFYGVDFTCLMEEAAKSHFSQVFIGPVDPKTILSSATPYHFDFCRDPVQIFQQFSVPFEFEFQYTGIMHGVAGWYDVMFKGSTVKQILSTAPSAPTTHWYQVRLLFANPVAVNRGQCMKGILHFEANNHRSHDLTIEAHLVGTDVSFVQSFSLHEQQFWNLNGFSETTPEALAIYSSMLYSNQQNSL